MIKLTAFHYKLKLSALEVYHNVNEAAESRIYEWEQVMATARAVNDSYIDKPFIEPHEFKQEDYHIKERQLRVLPEDILYAKENIDGLVEIHLRDVEAAFVIKETMEELDKYLP